MCSLKCLRRLFLLCIAAATVSLAAEPLPRLRVSGNQRFLVTEDGQPFFWLGDTAWRLMLKASTSDSDSQPAIDRYFANRAAKGFNVVQTRIVGGGNDEGAGGHLAFEEGDFSRPKVLDGPNNDFWDRIDRIIGRGAAHGLYFALLPVWANSVANDHQWVRDPATAYRYGHFMGARYGGRNNIIWIMGGDMFSPGRGVEDPKRMKMVRAMTEGVADGASGVDNYDGQADWDRVLMSYHPPGNNRSSSQFFHDEPWLDFNMIQTTTRFTFANYNTVAFDYARTPAKPTFECEAAYEESLPLNDRDRARRPGARVGPWDVRRAAYWSVFAGGFGFTYGNRNFISWLRKGETSGNGAYRPWYESLDTPGAFDMTHLKALMESRPFLSRIPDDSILIDGGHESPDRLVATRDRDGRYVLVYTPTGRDITVVMSAVSGSAAKAWWFNPRDGTATEIGGFSTAGTHTFEPPTTDLGPDWVLVLDSAAERFPPPGQHER